jgi:hypothetical protein
MPMPNPKKLCASSILIKEPIKPPKKRSTNTPFNPPSCSLAVVKRSVNASICVFKKVTFENMKRKINSRK